jgi:hypothetical protein
VARKSELLPFMDLVSHNDEALRNLKRLRTENMLGEPESQEGNMLLITNFSIVLLIFSYVFRVRITVETKIDNVANPIGVISVTSGWQASNGSHIE